MSFFKMSRFSDESGRHLSRIVFLVFSHSLCYILFVKKLKQGFGPEYRFFTYNEFSQLFIISKFLIKREFLNLNYLKSFNKNISPYTVFIAIFRKLIDNGMVIKLKSDLQMIGK